MEKVVIAAASYYNQNYYFNPQFISMPHEVRKEIKNFTIYAADKSKGIFSFGITNDDEMFLEAGAVDDDFNYDEIEGKMQLKQIEIESKDLFRKILLWHKFKTQLECHDEKRSEHKQKY